MITVFDNENNLIDCLEFVDGFEVFQNGQSFKINKNEHKFKMIYAKIENLFCNSRLMPAFGVSLHAETQNALQNDEWLQINFSNEMVKNGLPFTSLLFKLEKTSGINLIRLHNNKYEGRCIFLDLDEETDLNLILNTLDN